MRIIYLSPHLDDAVISAGGLIHAQSTSGLSVEIWSFMAGFPPEGELPPFAQAMHYIWGFASGLETVHARREEDLNAAAQVGARAVHFDFLDCIYRRGKQGQPLYPEITLPIQPDEADLPAQIAQTIIAWLQPDDRLVCLLAVGHHVDHVLVRRAAEMLHRPLFYLEDVPYVLNHPEELELSVAGLQAATEPVSEPDFQAWLEGIECYRSQVDSVFGSHEEMVARMTALWESRHGVRLWSAAAGG